MVWLIIGVLLWSAVHFVPTLARGPRERVIGKLGFDPYRGLFSLGILLSLASIVLGWRSTPEVYLYQLPGWSRTVGILLMLLAFVLLVSSARDTAVKRLVRHPQLMSIVVWSASHLISNGTTRAWVLFGGLGLWALVEIPLIDARDGKAPKTGGTGLAKELIGLAIAAAIFVVALLLHPYYAGVAPIAF